MELPGNINRKTFIDSALIIAIFAAITYVIEVYFYGGYYNYLGLSIDLFPRTVAFYQAGGTSTLLFLVIIITLFIFGIFIFNYVLNMIQSCIYNIYRWLIPPLSQHKEKQRSEDEDEQHSEDEDKQHSEDEYSQKRARHSLIKVLTHVLSISVIWLIVLIAAEKFGAYLAEGVYEGDCSLAYASYKDGEEIRRVVGCFVSASADNYLIMKLSEDKKVTHVALVIPKKNIEALEVENKKVKDIFGH